MFYNLYVLEDILSFLENDDKYLVQGKRILKDLLQKFKKMDTSEQTLYLKELAVNYAQLFLNAGKEPVYIYESVYLSEDRLVMQHQRDQVLEFYRKAGVSPSQNKEPEDHLAIQLEFMGYLSKKIFQKISEYNIYQAGELLKLQKDFLEMHLNKWVGFFVKRMEKANTSPLYLAIAYIIYGFLQMENQFIKYYEEQLTII